MDGHHDIFYVHTSLPWHYTNDFNNIEHRHGMTFQLIFQSHYKQEFGVSVGASTLVDQWEHSLNPQVRVCSHATKFSLSQIFGPILFSFKSILTLLISVHLFG